MKQASIVFAVAALTAILAVSCQETLAGLNDVYKQSPNMDDPNLYQQEGPSEEAPEVESIIVKEELRQRGPASFKRVRFCEEPKYRSAFPATGICINGKVYAEIGNTEGLYTRIKPGRVSANATGAPCSFTVRNNCEIGR